MNRVALKIPIKLPEYLKLIKFYQWIFTIFGLNLPPPLYNRDLEKPKRYLLFAVYFFYCALLLFAVFYSGHKHNILIQEISIIDNLDIIGKLFSFMTNTTLAVTQGYMKAKMFWQHKDLRDILNLMEQLENATSSQISRKKGSLKWNIFKLSGLWLIFLILAAIYLNYFLIAYRLDAPYRMMISFFVLTVQMKCIEYGIYIQIVCAIIGSIKNSLLSVKNQLKIDSLNVEQQHQHFNLLRQLIQIKQNINQVWFLVSRINKYFAGPLFLTLYLCGLGILYTANWAYLAVLYEIDYLYQTYRLLYILLLLINLTIICSITEKCIERFESIAVQLHNFKLSSQDYAVLMHLREFSLQLIHQHLKFTCNNYLDIDFNNMGKFILILTAYTVVLVQFKMEDASMGAMTATLKIFGKKV